MPSFTLVSTTFNEINRLDNSIQDIENQKLRPDKIIIVDAGSTDGTFEKLLAWKETSRISIEVIKDPGCNVAKGRNQAISLSATDLIASTDFGCRYHPEWLRSIIGPFMDDPALEVVGGAFKVLEEDILNLAQKADYVLQNGYRLKIDEHFSVSSRSVAYKKYVWEQIGGYPEWLTLAADDTIFWRQIRKRNYRYRLIDKPYVYWMRHRNFKGFAKEAGRYGLGDGESGINFRTYISHIIETTLRYSLFVHVLVVPFYYQHTLLPMLIFIPQLFGLRSYINAVKRWRVWRSEKIGFRVLLACFKMIELSRWQYIKGYTKGLAGRNKTQQEASKKLLGEIS